MSERIAAGGIQITGTSQPGQIIYLDFDGESTSYRGEALTLDQVVVEDPGLNAERIGAIVSLLNERFASRMWSMMVMMALTVARQGQKSSKKPKKRSGFSQFHGF